MSPPVWFVGSYDAPPQRHGPVAAAGHARPVDIATPDDQGPPPSRRRVITGVLQAFLDNAPDQGFLILGDPERPDEFLQFKRSAGIIYGEVGSRQWDAPERRRPLSPDAEATLAREGFTHGGVEKNHCRDELAQSAPYLAELVDRLVAAAYGRDFVDAPQVSSDVEPVCAAARRLGARVRPPSPSRPFDRELHYRRLWEPLRTTPGLAARAGRALRSNFFDQQLDTEDVLGFRAAVEAASGFDELPTWAQDWIRKAEQGPLQVRLRPPA